MTEFLKKLIGCRVCIKKADGSKVYGLLHEADSSGIVFEADVSELDDLPIGFEKVYIPWTNIQQIRWRRGS